MTSTFVLDWIFVQYKNTKSTQSTRYEFSSFLTFQIYNLVLIKIAICSQSH